VIHPEESWEFTRALVQSACIVIRAEQEGHHVGKKSKAPSSDENGDISHGLCSIEMPAKRVGVSGTCIRLTTLLGTGRSEWDIC
jgi:hypothetical protein